MIDPIREPRPSKRAALRQLAALGLAGVAGAALSANDPPPATSLTVQVLGNDKPVAGAQLKLKYAGGGEDVRHSDAQGQAAFGAATAGTAKLRVLAEGWESTLVEIQLKPWQANEARVQLQRLAAVKASGDASADPR